MLASPHFIWITGFRKKVEAAAKQKGCEIIGDWQRSIINHLYWCVSSTPDGDPETILAKWLSLENHVHNEHRHKDKKFPKCAHGKLTGRNRKKKWFMRRKCYTLHHSQPKHSCSFYRFEAKWETDQFADELSALQRHHSVVPCTPNILSGSIPQFNSTFCSQVCSLFFPWNEL